MVRLGLDVLMVFIPKPFRRANMALVDPKTTLVLTEIIPPSWRSLWTVAYCKSADGSKRGLGKHPLETLCLGYARRPKTFRIALA